VTDYPVSLFQIETYRDGVLIKQYATASQGLFQDTDGTYLLAHGGDSFLQGSDKSHLIYHEVPYGTNQLQTIWNIESDYVLGLEDNAQGLFILFAIATILYSAI